jgi:hypothetical protein
LHRRRRCGTIRAGSSTKPGKRGARDPRKETVVAKKRTPSKNRGSTPSRKGGAAPDDFDRDEPYGGSRIALNLARIIYRLLMDPRGWRVDDLMAELHIADRTYRKYRGLLQDEFDHLFDRQEGLVVEVRDGDARYLRLADSELPVEEHPRFVARVAALELARQAFDFLRATEIGQDLLDFQNEFWARVGDRTFVFRHLLRDLDRKFHHVPDAPKDYSGQQRKVWDVLHALVFNKRLLVKYDSGRKTWGPQLVDPLTLLVWRSGLYVLARMKGGRKEYLLAVDRMKAVERSGETFRYPSGFEFQPAKLFDGSFGIFRDDAALPTDVELVFANEKWLKLYLRERRWHPTQRFEDLPDGRLRMTFQVRAMQEVWRWVRSFGGEVEVVRPRA